MIAAGLLMVVVGGLLGLLGAGGSALAVPVLVYVAGLPPGAAVVTSLALVASSAGIAALLHARRGDVDLRAAALFTALGAPAAVLGSQLTPLVAPEVLLGLFGALLLVIGMAMLIGYPGRVSPASSDRPPRTMAVLVAVGVGGLTGFLGVGGGFLLLPALMWTRGLDLRTAAGTSLAIIAVNASVGLAGHHGDPIALGETAGYIGFAAAGALLGHAIARRARRDHLRLGFAALTFAVGGGVLASSLGCFPS